MGASRGPRTVGGGASHDGGGDPASTAARDSARDGGGASATDHGDHGLSVLADSAEAADVSYLIETEWLVNEIDSFLSRFYVNGDICKQ